MPLCEKVCSRGNVNKNNLLSIYTPNGANNPSYNPINNKPFSQERNKIAYIYNKKKSKNKL